MRITAEDAEMHVKRAICAEEENVSALLPPWIAMTEIPAPQMSGAEADACTHPKMMERNAVMEHALKESAIRNTPPASPPGERWPKRCAASLHRTFPIPA